MDPMAIGAVILLALGVLGADAVIHPASISVGFEVPSGLEKDGFGKTAVESVFMEEIYRIAATKSLTEAPTIKADREKSLATVVAQTMNASDLVAALQNKLGYQPDQMTVAMFSEAGATKVLVTGSNKRAGVFQEVVTQGPKELLVDLVRRAADVGASNIDPYLTALYLIQKHEADRNFQDAEALIHYAKSLLAATPVNPERARFDNLHGIISLFRNDPKAARASFEVAIQSDPKGSVAIINAAFADLQLGDRQSAADRMERMLRDAPPANEVLLMTAYMTWAAARIGTQDLTGADDLLAKAARAYPSSGAVFETWAVTKQLMGDSEAAAQLDRKARENAGGFANYAEIASLYFELPLQESGPVTRSKSTNTKVVSFH